MRAKPGLLGFVAAVAFIASSAMCPVFAQDAGLKGISPAMLVAAKKEGQLTLYAASQSDAVNALADGFRKAVPEIKVSVLRLATDALVTRFMSETDAGVFDADVLNTYSATVFDSRPDIWTRLDVAEIPALAIWPKETIIGHYVNTGQTTLGLAANKNLVSPDLVPKTWPDMLRPEFKGKGMMIDPRVSIIYMNWLNVMYEKYGEGFITRLRDQRFQIITGSVGGAVQQVAAGAMLIAIPPAWTHVNPYLEQGAPLAYNLPNENSDVMAIASLSSWGIPKKSPHPNAAKVFLSWSLTEVPQREQCKLTASASFIVTDGKGCPQPFLPFVLAGAPLAQDRIDKLTKLLDLK